MASVARFARSRYYVVAWGALIVQLDVIPTYPRGSGSRVAGRTSMNPGNSRANTYRWIARISGVLLTVFTLFIGIGEALEGRSRHPDATVLSQFSPLILTMFAIWGVGMVGLLVGWWRERLGGFLSICCFILVFVLSLFNSQAHSRIGALVPMLVFCVPSALFIRSWKIRSKQGQPAKQREGAG
jgi:succinate dehydrogenase hydrophobic anchor subunit